MQLEYRELTRIRLSIINKLSNISEGDRLSTHFEILEELNAEMEEFQHLADQLQDFEEENSFTL